MNLNNLSLLSSEFHNSHFPISNDDDDDADTASQRSISLSSSLDSPRHSIALSDDPHEYVDHPKLPYAEPVESPNLAHEFLSNLKHESHSYTLDTDFSSEADDSSLYMRDHDHDHGDAYDAITSPVTSAAPSVFDEPKTSAASSPTAVSVNDDDTKTATMPTYPPVPIHDPSTPRSRGDSESVTSFASGSSYSKKARPESTLLGPHTGPLVLGIALVDFNHLVGPRIEFCKGDIFDDEDICTALPFLALPDGAHLSVEDYSYFHLVPNSPNPSTIFGISCNRQIAASDLLVREADVTRSTVQKAVVVLASKPVFGPMRDKLGVVTRALFNQRDFSHTEILVDFATSLEISLRSQLTESGLYMGTSLRELVHTFRQRTLILVKALMLQKRIMFYGHPVERLCTYQYSLISLLPGLLQTLEDCGSPPLASRAPTLTKPNSLRTSDRKSMMAYLGLPLDVFGKDAFFQPYIPLQQLDMIKETKSWLCGSTNTIVTGQKEIDLLVNTETGQFEFRDQKLERSAGLTAADRKWMDDIVRDVNDGWNDEDPTRPNGMQFKGSDDYLRTKFEEYVSAALASVRYRDFVAKGEMNGVLITGGSGGDASSAEDFNPLWISEFKKTNAFEVWDRTTDTMLFDIVEPRHPCNEKPSVVADISLRLAEGIQELKLEQQLAPTREAITRTFTAGSTGFFKAVEGVRGRWHRSPSSTSVNNANANDAPASASNSVSSISSTPVAVTPPINSSSTNAPSASSVPQDILTTSLSAPVVSQESPARLSGQKSSVDLGAVATEAKAVIGTWGAGLGSFWSSRTTRFSMPRPTAEAAKAPVPNTPNTPERPIQPKSIVLSSSESQAEVEVEQPMATARPSTAPPTGALKTAAVEPPQVEIEHYEEAHLQIRDLDSVHTGIVVYGEQHIDSEVAGPPMAL